MTAKPPLGLHGRVAVTVFMLLVATLLLFPTLASADGLPGITSTTGPGGKQTYSLSVQMLVLITSLSFLPALLLLSLPALQVLIFRKSHWQSFLFLF